ncbi:hypothetical protein SDC9_195926 [bioreactor metagenome]|uniref:Uncharacterized protein n=1 Tax=bioreactor metagenome TaxID=1076179 RepID=A0A645ICY6_9ZZZZ
MKTFPNDAKKIKITFICDACGEDTPMEPIEIAETCDLIVPAVCPICFKEFDVKIKRTAEKSWIEIEDVAENEITVEVM